MVRDYINQVLRETGLSGKGLADLIGVRASTINKPLSDNPNIKHTISLKTLLKIEEKTRIPVPERIKLEASKTGERSPEKDVAAGFLQAQNKNSFYEKEPRNDLPLLGVVDFLTSELRIEGDMSDVSVERPASLRGRNGAYCVPMNDSSMHPVYSEGFPLYVDRERAAVPGDDVVIRFKDGRAVIRRLVRRSSGKLICEQFNPPGPCDYIIDTISSVDMIVANGRLRI